MKRDIYQSINWEHYTAILRCFFAVQLVGVHFFFHKKFTAKYLEGAEWLWPVSWLAEGASAYPALLLLLGVYSILCLIAMVQPYSRFIKITAAIVFLFLLAAQNSFGKINHSFHGALFISFAIAMIGHPEKSDFRWSAKWVHVAIIWLLFPYTLSGLWKFKQLLFSDGVSIIEYLRLGLPHAVISAKLWGTDSQLGMMNYLLSHPVLASSLWLGVISIEVIAVFAAIRVNHFTRLVGFALVCMHFSIFWLLNIKFYSLTLMVLLFVVLHPFGVGRLKTDL